MSKHGRDGLLGDLRTMAARDRMIRERRQVLQLLAGASLIPILGCGSSSSDGATTTDTGAGGTDSGTSGTDTAGTDTSTTVSECGNIPEETGGPYPGDGTNGPNALTTSGIVRSDIRSSFGAMSGTADGVPMTLKLTLVNTNAKCAALAGYAIYAWHCDRDGNYSLYTAATQNYLRGVQETDANGVVQFTTIFPGAYSGRWPHIHFEIFSSLAKATSASGKVRTTQLALPEAACKEAYTATGYEKSITNLSSTTLATDNVFSDGSTLQVATVTGSVAAGYAASLIIGIAV
jgi:protocatechuate 3,4-dioxygenase beta subunit